jgi:hypothetical protein
VVDELRVVAEYTGELKSVWALLQPENGPSANRRQDFDALAAIHANTTDPVRQHFGRLMLSFASGLFAGDDDAELPADNLDLERAFRLPKSHERRIHGHAHAGVRIVQQGPTLVAVLDAHQRHADPFAPEDLFPYATATVPAAQLASERRRGIMRQARSSKARGNLLAGLERRFEGTDPET